LLLALLLELNQTVPGETLVDRLWPQEELPSDPGNALQVLVSYLRKVLGSADGPTIVTEAGGYRLVAQPDDVDAHRLAALVEQASQESDVREKLRLAEAALELWRGAPLAEIQYEAWAEPEVSRLEELRLVALDERADALLGLGREQEAVAQLQRTAGKHPMRERSVAQLMLAWYRSGRQADALAAYEALRRALADELGIDPSPALQRLHLQVLKQAPDLVARPTVPAVEPAREVASAAPEPASRLTLPVPLTRLIGRDPEVDRVEALLHRHRLVTLTGPGGAGKTRLAAEVAGRLSESQPLVGWVDLAATRDTDSVTSAVVAAIGLQPVPGAAAFTATQVRNLCGVLLLDTCEHVIAPLRALLRDLLGQAPQLAVLASSRRPIGVPGEMAWPVSPLSLPDPEGDPDETEDSAAVQLFVERAREVDPDFALSGDNAAAVSRICVMLDGLPLALELAASQLGAMSAAKLVELLTDRLRVLVSEQGAGRHDALRTTIEWSYRLLDEPEAVFFERLSVFGGTFPLEAAAAVAGEGLAPDSLRLLLSLVRHSLVAPIADDRFRLLDTLRAYAAERLASRSGEPAATRIRHARWYRDVAVEADAHLRDRDQGRWLERLRNDLPDLRAALEWALTGSEPAVGVQLAAALSWFWSFDGLFTEASRYLSTAAALAEPGSLNEAHVSAALGLQASSLGRLPEAAARSREAADLYERHGEELLRARALLFVGVSTWAQGRYDESEAVLDTAIGVFERRRDAWGEGFGALLRARTAAEHADVDVRGELEHARRLLEQSGDEHLVALALEQLARAELRAGHLAEAEPLAGQALTSHERVGYLEGAIAARNTLGLVRTALGRTAQAREDHLQALRLAVKLGHPGSTAEAAEGLALATVSDDSYQALVLLAAADRVRAAAGVYRVRTQGDAAASIRRRVAAQLDGAALAAATAAGRDLDLTLVSERRPSAS
jgi:predicted ATPase/DNA-binding SARP family transcriptional activator